MDGLGLVLVPELGDDLLGVDDADEALFVVHDGEGAEVVLVEEVGDLFAVGFGVATDNVAVGQVDEGLGGVGEDEADDGDEGADAVLVRRGG